MLNLVLFGPPGAGKGTQSNLLIDKYNLVHLSTGDILRGEITAGTSLGLEAKLIMDRGDLVSDEIVIGMISSKLDNNPNSNGFIFDGFPRTAAQANALDNLLSDKGTSISAMLSLKVEDAELKNESIIANRINEYNNKTAPLKDFYANQEKLSEIEGTGTVENIAQKLIAVIDSL
jgi:adenylate kinase